jgi:hypothetical protein
LRSGLIGSMWESAPRRRQGSQEPALYSRVKVLEIGLDKDAALESARPLPSPDRWSSTGEATPGFLARGALDSGPAPAARERPIRAAPPAPRHSTRARTGALTALIEAVPLNSFLGQASARPGSR